MPRRLIPILLTAMFVAHAWAMAIAVPVWQAPDEPLHFAVARFVHQHGHYPNGRADLVDGEVVLSLGEAQFGDLKELKGDWDVIGDPNWPSMEDLLRKHRKPHGGNVEAGHPPLYYLTLAPLDVLLDGLSFPTEVLLLRMFSVLLAAPAVWLAFATVRLVWPRLMWLAVVVGAFLALVPQIAHTAGSINNDTLMMSLGAAVLYLTARIVLEGPGTRLLALGSLFVLAGIFTKATGLVMLVVFGLGVLWAVFSRRAGLLRPALALAVPVVAAGAWYGLRIRAGLPVGPVEARPYVPIKIHRISSIAYLRRFAFPRAFTSFWGRMGWLIVPLPDRWYRGLEVGTLLGALASSGALVAAAMRRRLERHRTAFGVLAVLAAVLVAGSMFRSSIFAYRTYGEPRVLQGRYLFPVAGVLGAMLFGGFIVLAGRFRAIVGSLVVFGLVVVTCEGLWTVLRAFYGGNGVSLRVLASHLSAFSPLSIAFPTVVALFALVVVCAGTVVTLCWRSGRRPAGEEAEHLVVVSL